jgi:signal transduction histidine kinase
VAAVATLFRRRLPRSALAVVFPIAVAALALRAGGPTVFYVALALYCVVVVSSRRAAVALTGIVAGAVLAALIVGHGDQLARAAIGGVALLLLGWLAGENSRASLVYAAQQAERAREKAAAAEAERAAQVRRAMADERAQIARELHDIVAHAMSVIAVRSGVARMVIDTDPEQAREALGIIETTTRRSLHEMRLLVSVLREARADPAELSPAPGLRDLGRLVAAAAAAGVTADVQIEGTARSLSSSAELSAYRIVQEALTNVARHAGPAADEAGGARPGPAGHDRLRDRPGHARLSRRRVRREPGSVLGQAGLREHGHVAVTELATARFADDHGRGGCAAGRVGHPDGPVRAAVLVTPLAHGRQHRPQVAARVGQQVVIPGRVIGVRDLGQDAGTDQLGQPVPERVARHAEVLPEVIKPGHAIEGISHDEHRPRVTHGLQALRDRAAHVGERLPFHGLRVVSCIIRYKLLPEGLRN